jgi:hypothetical protein
MDWNYVFGMTTEEIHSLNDLEELRINDPVLWVLVILGCQTSRIIANRLGWPQEHTLNVLRDYKANGRTYDYEGHVLDKGMVWELMPDELDLLQLRNEVHLRRKANRQGR